MDLIYHYLQIVALGIVEGVTEFLPISSTGHLLIAEGLGLGHEPDVFNVVIQAGAILAVVFIYWNTIVELFTRIGEPGPRMFLFKIIGSFAVTGVIGIILTKFMNPPLKLPETLTPVAWATLIGGIVIFIIEFFVRKLYAHDDISWVEAIAMGLAQVLAAVFPGTSRSGATIMTGLALGVRRPAATQFSFLVGIPTMFAASALDLWSYRKDLTTGGHQLLIDIAVGFVVSMIVAFFVVKWLLRFVQSHTFNGFAVYRVILGGVLLIALATHVIPEGEDAKAALKARKKAEKDAALNLEQPPTLAPAAAPVTNPPPATNPAPADTNTPTATPIPDATNPPPVQQLQPATNAAPVKPADGSSQTSSDAAPVFKTRPINTKVVMRNAAGEVLAVGHLVRDDVPPGGQ